MPLRSRRRAPFGLLLVSATLAGSLLATYFGLAGLVASRRDAIRLAENQTQNLAQAIDQSISATLRRVDHTLTSMAREIEAEIAGGRGDLERVRRRIPVEQELLPEAWAIRVSDASGRVILNNPTGDPLVSYAERPYFKYLKEHAGTGVYVTKPILGMFSKRWVITSARRYDRPDGTFGGVVVASVFVEHFQKALEGYNLGRTGFLTLRDVGGGFVTRTPFSVGGRTLEVGDARISGDLKAFLASGVSQRTYFARTVFDEMKRTVTARRIAGAPLVVLAGFAEEDYLAPWHKERIRTLGFLAVFVVGGWFLAGWMWHLWRSREQSSAALAESETKFARAFHCAPVILAITDLDSGEYLDVNDEALRVSGFTREEVLGRTAIDVGWITAASRARMLDALRSRGRIVDAEYEFHAKDGTTIVGLVSGEVVGISGRDCLLTVTADITGRKESEEALRLSEKRYREIVENQVEFVNRYRPGGILTFVNGPLARFVGKRAENLVGTSFYPYLHDEDREATIRSIEALSREEPICVVENRVVSPDGETHWHQWTHSALFDDAGALLEFQAVGRDITNRRRQKAQRERLDDQLRQAQRLEAVGTLAGGIAHDFNNILTPVMAHAELALMQLDAEHPVRFDIDQLLKAAERARDLVRQILVITNREVDGPMVPVPLGSLVTEVTKFLRASLPATIEIRAQIDPACGPVLGEFTQLHQVLLNLCTNAGYAMQESGGVLAVSLERAQDVPDGARVRLRVHDTGTGIPPDVIGRIFEPYFTTKPPGKGSGLGLSVCYGIVTKLGGEIRVVSAPGEGTTFEILLPEAERPREDERGGPRELPKGRGQTLLVVDDETAIRDVLRRMLRGLGYRVVEASGGAEALAALRDETRPIDGLITDYTMPGINGLDLASEALRLRPGLPVVLGTGYAEAVNEAVVKERGIRCLVIKPYTMQRLAEAVEQALEQGD